MPAKKQVTLSPTVEDIDIKIISDEKKDKNEKRKEKQKKGKKGKDEKRGSSEEKNDDHSQNGDGGFILSDEEMKNRGMELSTEEQRIQQKFKENPSCADHFIFSPKLRILYVILLCVALGLAIPYLLTSEAFGVPEQITVPGNCLINSTLRVSCRDEDEIDSELCFNLGCCYDDTLVASNIYIPKCYHRLPSVYRFVIDDDPRMEIDVRDSQVYRLADEVSVTFNCTNKNESTIYETKAWDAFVTLERSGEDVVRVVLSSPENDEGSPLIGEFDVQSASNYSLDVILEQNEKSGVTITVLRLGKNESGSAAEGNIRKEEDIYSVALFETFFGPTQYGENYVEISAKVPSEIIYGLGPRDAINFLPNFDQWQRWSMMSQEKARAHGVFPFYLLREPSGRFHGVLLMNASPLEVDIVPTPSVVFRALRGPLDLRFFSGPTPTDVSRQLASHIGFPEMPPYWALGYHLCRSTDEKDHLESYRTAVEDMESLSVPYESDCINGHVTYPESFGPLPEDVAEEVGALKAKGRKFLMVAHPFLAADESTYQTAFEADVLVKIDQNTSYFGSLGETTVAYPDFFDEGVLTKWLFVNHTAAERYSLADGAILLKNSPLNEAQLEVINDLEEVNCTVETPELCCPPDDLSFRPINLPSEITNGTICWSAIHQTTLASHLSIHNLYGAFHALRIKQLLHNIESSSPNRSFITSSSLFPGTPSGFLPESYGPDFVEQQKALSQVLLMGLYGTVLSGTPLCGSVDDGQLKPEWCLRAHQNAVLLPFAMSYYEEGQIPRGPTFSTSQNFTQEFVKNLRTFIRMRYMFQPYLYTLFYEASQNGIPVARPLFYEFPDDKGSFDVSTQYMSGSALLVTPALSSMGTSSETSSIVTAHFPPGCWYDFYSGHLFLNNTLNSTDAEISILSTELKIHVRGGYAIPLQGELTNDSLITTDDWRKSFFTFIIAIDCENRNRTQDGELDTIIASGLFYQDDGITILENNPSSSFVHIEAFLTGVNVFHKGDFCGDNKSNVSSILKKLRVFGLPTIDTNSTTVNGMYHGHTKQNSDTLAVDINSLAADWCVEDIEIRWDILETDYEEFLL